MTGRDDFGSRICGYIFPPITRLLYFLDLQQRQWRTVALDKQRSLQQGEDRLRSGIDRPQYMERVPATTIRIDLPGGQTEILYRSPAKRWEWRRQPLGGLAIARYYVQHEHWAAHRCPISLAFKPVYVHFRLVHGRRQCLDHGRSKPRAERDCQQSVCARYGSRCRKLLFDNQQWQRHLDPAERLDRSPAHGGNL